jgi:uncharacterized membrane protein
MSHIYAQCLCGISTLSTTINGRRQWKIFTNLFYFYAIHVLIIVTLIFSSGFVLEYTKAGCIWLHSKASQALYILIPPQLIDFWFLFISLNRINVFFFKNIHLSKTAYHLPSCSTQNHRMFFNCYLLSHIDSIHKQT